MKRFVVVALVVGLALAVQGAWALTLQGQSAYSWQAWVADNSGEYWDNPSSDPGHGNIGMEIGPMSTAPYFPGKTWASVAGAADPDVYFTSAGSDWAALKIEIAGLASSNKFGVYKKGDPNTKLMLFSGSAGPGASIVFNPLTALGSTDFGFYLTSPRGTWYTESSLNDPGQTSDQHFAFFEAPPLVPGLKAYYIGAEDTPFLDSNGQPWADRDYQDMVVYVSNIPDASTWMLFLSGMPAVLMLRRRRS